jgi:hypothetical protein
MKNDYDVPTYVPSHRRFIDRDRDILTAMPPDSLCLFVEILFNM